MSTLRLFADKPESIPLATAWYLADLGEARGKQELFTRQSPQVLKALREHALIESAVSSNRIEGVLVDQSRVATVVFGKSRPRDRDKSAYRELEERVGKIKSPRGAKTSLIQAALASLGAEFTLTELERVCPGVSRDMIRRVLRDLQRAGQVECLGRGPGATWRKRKRKKG